MVLSVCPECTIDPRYFKMLNLNWTFSLKSSRLKYLGDVIQVKIEKMKRKDGYEQIFKDYHYGGVWFIR